MERMVIGIAGGTGSGKTTLTERIKERFGDDVSVIFHDSYYKDNAHLTHEERSVLNYDHPSAYETDLMIEDIALLKQGISIECPVYDYKEYRRSLDTMTVKSTSVIIIEGILIFENAELRSLMDVKVFVDTDADTRILRRIMRDVHERNRGLDSIIKQYLTTVKPMHEKYVEPSKRKADIIIPEGGLNEVALDMMINRINNHISKK